MMMTSRQPSTIPKLLESERAHTTHTHTQYNAKQESLRREPAPGQHTHIRYAHLEPQIIY